jgi:hypothetical protein
MINGEGYLTTSHIHGLTRDSRLTYSKHVTNKLFEKKNKIKLLYTLLGSPVITARLKFSNFKIVMRTILLYNAFVIS